MEKETFVNIGKAGFYAEFFSRLPADTDVTMGNEFLLDPILVPDSIKFSICRTEIRHTMRLDKDGKLVSKVNIPIHIYWNHEGNVGCKTLIRELIDMYLYSSGYDRRKLPGVDSLANTIANNPCAFFDLLSDFQKKYKRKKEEHND